MATRPWDAGALFRGARLAVRASALMAVADDDECVVLIRGFNGGLEIIYSSALAKL
jgi:hypothetical protein